MKPAISVVMKSYNHAPYVAQSIASILDQSFADFEIVISDDGSTDGTPEIIRGFSDPRIRFMSFEENSGIAAAMNSATVRAAGEFIAILNSDDFALPGRLAAQVAFLRQHDEIAAVFGLPRQVGEDGETTLGFEPFETPFIGAHYPRQAWLRHLFFHGNCLCAPTAMIRRSAYADIGNDDRRLTNLHDLDRWVRLLERFDIYVLPDELTAFRVRADGRNASAPSRASYLRAPFECFQIFKRYRHLAPEFLREIFAEDLERHGIDASGRAGVWLAEVALTGTQAWHPLYALDTLFEAAGDDRAFRRLAELTGTLNVLRLPDQVE
jgi:glycosyltransferase involved in cell wall biosynthesis